jgi:hypothetical protein
MDRYPALFVKTSFVYLALGVTLGVLVGNSFRVHLAARAALNHRLGTQTFSCLGIATETLAQSAKMHGMNPIALLEEVNVAILAAKPGTGAVAR